MISHPLSRLPALAAVLVVTLAVVVAAGPPTSAVPGAHHDRPRPPGRSAASRPARALPDAPAQPATSRPARVHRDQPYAPAHPATSRPARAHRDQPYAPAHSATSRPARVHRDLAYAPAQPAGTRGHLLDLYLPAEPATAPRPLLIVMGGSGWFADDGKGYAPALAPHFTAAGHVVAGVSTRSSHQAKFPAQVDDVRAAIRWLRAHATDYGIDPRRMAVLGDSSGGWTALMAGFTGTGVRAVVDLYAPVDFTRMDAHMLPGACDAFNRAFGSTACHADPRSPESALLGCPIRTCPDRVAAADPRRLLTRSAPPVLIIHGTQDALVPLNQSELLFEALAEASVPATLYTVPGAGHSRDIVSPRHRRATVRHTGERMVRDADHPTYGTIEAFLRAAMR
ncbi:alpha/beta hydrolase [Actinoplanes teichomyceticus]|uniref:Acetyl esterase/lipase n=1 Tax=Actinoplanes teichomyceticus TaxID=1867 RepID=A0A561VQW4_ACTTI|nr:alpha/beta hydrolase [Actinoplanes teichomyceticus]TWG14009.1 acetyl esterase/lipase [Actinoplanes teichomyceticus]